jgi:hypothetical protein
LAIAELFGRADVSPVEYVTKEDDPGKSAAKNCNVINAALRGRIRG